MDAQLTWLLDEHQEEEASNLRAAIEAIGDLHITISRQEARYGTAALTIPLQSCPTLAYGSFEFVKAVRSDFYPGKWCDWTALRCERYYARVGALLLNDDYVLLPAGEVLRRQKDLLESWNRVFMRPVRADKPFAGFVAARDRPEEIERNLRCVEAHELIVLARPKRIEAEYRAIVMRERGIVAVSQYMQDGERHLHPQIPAQARQVTEEVVQALGNDFPDPMYVVDIARSQGLYRLLEINSFSASLFYTCDLEAVVRAAHAEAMREWHEINA
jgi:hypothetical protein